MASHASHNIAAPTRFPIRPSISRRDIMLHSHPSACLQASIILRLFNKIIIKLISIIIIKQEID